MRADSPELVEALARREVTLVGMITDETAVPVIAQLLYLDGEDRVTPILLRIDSVGGVVTSSLAIYDAIRDLAAPVHTSVVHAAAGTAIMIAAAGAVGHRCASADARYTFVPMRSPGRGNEAEVPEVVRLRDAVARHLATHSLLDHDEALAAMEQGLVLDAGGAIELGLCDRLTDDIGRPSER